MTALTAPARPYSRPAAVVVAAGLATIAGFALSASAPALPGAEPPGVEDLVDAAAGVAAGVLGWIMLRRGVAAGLGRALLALTAVVGAVWLAGGLADLLAGGGSPAPAARALQAFAAVLFIPSYALLVLAPLLLFPDGRLPGRAARAVAWLGGVGVVVSMLALLLRSGPLDEDVPAWGANPFGVPALYPVTGAAAAAGLALLAAAALGALVVYVVRLVRRPGVVRRQMLWYSLGLVPMIGAVVADDALPGALGAAVVFAALYGGLAFALFGPPARDPR